MVSTYEKKESPDVAKWMAGTQKKRQRKTGPGRKYIDVEDIPDLPHCPMKYEAGKPFLPDWTINEVPFLVPEGNQERGNFIVGIIPGEGVL